MWEDYWNIMGYRTITSISTRNGAFCQQIIGVGMCWCENEPFDLQPVMQFQVVVPSPYKVETSTPAEVGVNRYNMI